MPSRKPAAATLKDTEIPREVLGRLARVQGRLDKARSRIAEGRSVLTESEDRLKLIAERARLQRRPTAEDKEPPLPSAATRADVHAVERIIGADDILPIGFFGRGLIAARSVGRIAVLGGAEHATGFLVSPDMLMTNNHVMPDEARAAMSDVEFELHDPTGRLTDTRLAELDPGRFWFTDADLDITLVALADDPQMREATEGLGWHPMISQQGKIRIGNPVNIIQHPGGRPKSVVVHNSNLLHLENGTDLTAFLWYSSDTEPGSSGAPVMNSRWEVVGVHHRSVPDTNPAGELVDAEGRVLTRAEFTAAPHRAVWIANEGTRTSRIVAALEVAAFGSDRMAGLRDDLLALWEGSRVRNQGQAAALRASEATVQATESARARFGATVVRGAGVTVQIIISPDEN